MGRGRRSSHSAQIVRTGALIAIFPALAGCSLALDEVPPEAGGEDSSSRPTTSFRRVDLGIPARTTITVGARRSVVLRCRRGLLGEIKTSVSGGTLSVFETRPVATHYGLSMAISVPTLDAVTLSSAGTVHIQGVCGRSFEVKLTGSGMLTVSGRVGRLDVSVSGAGIAQLDALSANEVRVDVSGTGSARVRASRSLDARLSGVGSILYGGNPAAVTREVTGIGIVTPF